MTAADLHEAAAYAKALMAEANAITPADVRSRSTTSPMRSVQQQTAVVIRDTTWRAEASCHGADPDLWYPRRFDAATEQAAKAICATCPVRHQCLIEALEHNEGFGIWGGLSETDRRTLRRQLPRWVHCSVCGRRYTQTRRKQRTCGDDCPGRSENRRTA